MKETHLLLVGIVLIAGFFLYPQIKAQFGPEYEKIAMQVESEYSNGDCVENSTELNKRLLAKGYDSRIVNGTLWKFDCENSDPSTPMQCFDGAHKWVEVCLWIESTNGMVVPNELKQYYEAEGYG